MNAIKAWFSERLPISQAELAELTNEPVPNHLRRWWFCLGGTPAYLLDRLCDVTQGVEKTVQVLHMLPDAIITKAPNPALKSQHMPIHLDIVIARPPAALQLLDAPAQALRGEYFAHKALGVALYEREQFAQRPISVQSGRPWATEHANGALRAIVYG